MILETAVSALIGLLGTCLTTYSNYKMKQLETDSKIRLLEAENRNMIAEAEANIKIAQTNASMQIELNEANAFASSIASSKQSLPSEWLSALLGQKGWWRILTYPIGVLLLLLMGIVDVVNRIMRPALTIYSLGIASWVTYQCWNILPVAAGADTAWRQWEDAASTVMLLAVTMVTWWFGDRRVAKNLMHMRGGK